MQNKQIFKILISVALCFYIFELCILGVMLQIFTSGNITSDYKLNTQIFLHVNAQRGTVLDKE